ncbi:MAG: hypothetical protein LGB71_02595 [Sulfurovum sp.]|nr:hypothetical protein [Sulfurovum sp.]MCB4774165.1 hypothetical protein [Sulfurovum sp.]MCB4777357.1 hypothetical protein [Sulfurovum sp.]
MKKNFILKPESEPLILEAFSKRNLQKIKEFHLKKQTFFKKQSNRKLTVEDLLILR